MGCGCPAYLLVSGECLASRLGQVDDRHDRPIGSLWDPVLDIAAARVEPGALEIRVEDAEVGRSICATAGHPLPGDRPRLRLRESPRTTAHRLARAGACSW